MEFQLQLAHPLVPSSFADSRLSTLDRFVTLRVDGRNIFIAECKIWIGADSLKRAIDQLLGYTAWRDTKTAIVMFNRNKNTSAVLNQIPQTAKSHPNLKRELPGFRHQSGFRFLLHQRDDKNRELILTVLVFDVPGGRGADAENPSKE